MNHISDGYEVTDPVNWKYSGATQLIPGLVHYLSFVWLLAVGIVMYSRPRYGNRNKEYKVQKEKGEKKNSPTGDRTRAARMKAENPDHWTIGDILLINYQILVCIYIPICDPECLQPSNALWRLTSPRSELVRRSNVEHQKGRKREWNPNHQQWGANIPSPCCGV